jgi:hypothetical protein
MIQYYETKREAMERISRIMGYVEKGKLPGGAELSELSKIANIFGFDARLVKRLLRESFPNLVVKDGLVTLAPGAEPLPEPPVEEEPEPAEKVEKKVAAEVEVDQELKRLGFEGGR